MKRRFFIVLLATFLYGGFDYLLLQEVQGKNSPASNNILNFSLILAFFWLLFGVLTAGVRIFSYAYTINEYEKLTKPGGVFTATMSAMFNNNDNAKPANVISRINNIAGERATHSTFLDRIIWWYDEIGCLSFIFMLVIAGYVWTGAYVFACFSAITLLDWGIWNARTKAVKLLAAKAANDERVAAAMKSPNPASDVILEHVNDRMLKSV